MADLRLELLGGMAILRDGAPVALRSRKARAVLGLLAAARHRTLPRPRLAATLWDGSDASGARTSLRQALAQIRRAAGEGWLTTVGRDVALAPSVSTDVDDFAAALNRGDDAAAVRIYCGPFLDGLEPGSDGAAAPIGAERARLSDLAAAALRREIARLGERAEGAQAAHRLLSIDPLDEVGHRALMTRDAARGARGAARARFDELSLALRRELGADPEPETTALMERIRRGGAARREGRIDAGPGPMAASPERMVLAVAMESGDAAAVSAHRGAAEDSGARWLDAAAGEAAMAWPDGDLLKAASAVAGMARTAGPTLTFGMVAADAHAGSTGPDRSLIRARRMAARAEPGTVLLAPELAGRLGLPASGDAPVPLALDAPARRAEPPMVGREIEGAQIAAAIDAAADAGAGLVLHLSGEAGIGKTRLAEEVVRARRAAGARVVRVGFSAFAAAGRAVARDIAAALPDDAFGAPSDPSALALREWLHDRPMRPELELRLSAMDWDARLQGIATELSDALRRAADGPGLIALIEDCHWAPAGADRLLIELACRLSDAPVTLVLTERPHDAALDRRLAARGRTRLLRLVLTPLPTDAAMRLARIVAPGRADLDATLRQAAGHPLFLLRLLEAGWTDGALPGSVTALVLEQIERLPAGDREALRRASVLGRSFDPGDFAAVFPGHPVPHPQGDLLHGDVAGMTFGHDLVHRAIYDALPENERAAWHAVAASWFRGTDPVRWAEHALRTSDDAEACRAAMAAANAMIAAMRLNAAMRYVEDGLSRAAGADGEVVAELHSCRAGIRRLRGGLSGALEDYRTAHAVAQADATRVAMLVRQALVLHRLDRGAEADRALDAAEAIADAIGLRGLGRAEIHEQRGNRAFVTGDAAACLRHHEAGLAAATRVRDPRGMARAQGGIGDAHVLSGRLRSAAEAFEAGVALAAEAGLGVVHQELSPMRAYTRLFADPGAQAHALADLAVEGAVGAGADRAEMLARNVRAELRLAALQLDGARDDIDRIATLIERDPERRFAADVALMRSWLALREGDRPAAFAHAEPQLAAARSSYYNGAVLLSLGALSAPEDGTRTALLDAADDRIARGAMAPAAIGAHCFALEAAARIDDHDRAERHIAALRRLNETERLGLLDMALRVAGERFTTVQDADIRIALEGARLGGLAAILDAG